MSDRDDAAYYWIRAAEELARAEQAGNPTIAAVHHDLAYRYGALAALADNQEPQVGRLDSRLGSQVEGKDRSGEGFGPLRIDGGAGSARRLAEAELL